MDKDCKTFEKGYKKVENNHTNKNQKDGKKLFLFINLFLLSLSSLFIKKYRKYLIVITLIIFLSLIFYIFQDPVRLVRTGDYIINSNIETGPFLDLQEYFPNYKYLEEKTDIFQKELKNLLDRTNNGKDIPNINDQLIKINGKEKGWKVYQIKLGSNIVNTAKNDFPELVKTIEKYPEILNVAISVLERKSKIEMHIGYYKGIIRYMLPLKVPKDKSKCFLCVNGEKYIWKEGKSILWDDNFPHKVYNHSEETRVVIFIDVVRPHLDWKRKIFNNFALSLLNDSAITKKEIEKTEKKQKIE